MYQDKIVYQDRMGVAARLPGSPSGLVARSAEHRDVTESESRSDWSLW